MDVNVTFGLEKDVERIKDAIQRLDWYREHGYRPYLPDGITATSSDVEIRQAVSDGQNDMEYERFSQEITKKCNELGKRFEETIKRTLGVRLPETIEVDLTRYGVWGSYNLPNRIVFSVHTKDGVMTLFHEMLHLAMEADMQENQMRQWEKERTIDLILHSGPFSFLGYAPWQKDYHGAESYVDPLFARHFFLERERFFEEVSKARP